MIAERVTDLIGNTPLLKIPAEITGLKNIDLYGKLEMMNPFGSLKDRIAWAMLKDDLPSIIANRQKVFENSSGNTAKALNAILNSYGVPFKLLGGLKKVEEQKDIIFVLGGEVEEFAGVSDCFDPNDPNDPQYLIEKAVKESNGTIFFTSQFSNDKNPRVHEETTAREIFDDLGPIDFLIGGLGTTGSTLGITRFFKGHNPQFKTVGLVSKQGDFIPGIRALDQLWEAGLYEEGKYEHTFDVAEKDALDAMVFLNRSLGLLCGPSSGGNYAGAMSYLKTIDGSLAERKTAVFIVCDRVEWYLSYIKARMPELFGEDRKPDSLFHFDFDGNDASMVLPIAGANDWIDSHDPVIVDIRSSLAYNVQSIPGSLNIPIDIFEKLIDGQTPFPKDRPVLLACAVGEKTRRHAAYLRQRGYKAYTLEDGMLGWRKSEVACRLAA